MKPPSKTARDWRPLVRPYRVALCRYLRQERPPNLLPALALGRRALALGLETLDLARVHDRVLTADVLPYPWPAGRPPLTQRAARFFAAVLLPIEKTHRSALDAGVSLRRINRALRRRTRELVAANRELKREVARRLAAEATLRQSEQHSVGLVRRSHQLQEQLRTLSRQLLSSQEEERKRISRELHDVLAQVLTDINVRLASLRMDTTTHSRGLGRTLGSAQRLVEKSVSIVHRFARDLRPAALDDLGLIPALHSFLKDFVKETGVRVSLTAFAGVEALDGAQRTTLYRVAQEALANVARHAHASQAEVTIRKLAGDVSMEIRDNGRSFDAEQVLRARKGRHLGLLGMRERVEMAGGRFAVAAAPGRGTTVQARIPFHTSARKRSHP